MEGAGRCRPRGFVDGGPAHKLHPGLDGRGYAPPAHTYDDEDRDGWGRGGGGGRARGPGIPFPRGREYSDTAPRPWRERSDAAPSSSHPPPTENHLALGVRIPAISKEMVDHPHHDGRNSDIGPEMVEPNAGGGHRGRATPPSGPGPSPRTAGFAARFVPRDLPNGPVAPRHRQPRLALVQALVDDMRMVRHQPNRQRPGKRLPQPIPQPPCQPPLRQRHISPRGARHQVPDRHDHLPTSTGSKAHADVMNRRPRAPSAHPPSRSRTPPTGIRTLPVLDRPAPAC